MATVSYIANTSKAAVGNAGGNQSLTSTLSVQAGDVVVVFAYSSRDGEDVSLNKPFHGTAGGGFAPPAWDDPSNALVELSKVATNNSGAAWCGYGIASATRTAAFTYGSNSANSSTNFGTHVVVLQFRGVWAAHEVKTDVDVTLVSHADPYTPSWTGVNTDANDCLMIQFVGVDYTGNTGASALSGTGWTERYDSPGITTAWVGITAATFDKTGSGDPGANPSFDWTASDASFNLATAKVILNAVGSQTGTSAIPLGTLTLSAVGKHTVNGTATVAPTFTLSAIGRRLVDNPASLDFGTLTLATTGQHTGLGQAGFNGNGFDLSVIGTGSAEVFTTFTLGGLTLTAPGRRIVKGSASFTPVFIMGSLGTGSGDTPGGDGHAMYLHTANNISLGYRMGHGIRQ